MQVAYLSKLPTIFYRIKERIALSKCIVTLGYEIPPYTYYKRQGLKCVISPL
jgi:hypothetical protein